MATNDQLGKIDSRVDEKEMSVEEAKEVWGIAQQNNNSPVIGMVIYKQHLYTVHQTVYQYIATQKTVCVALDMKMETTKMLILKACVW